MSTDREPWEHPGRLDKRGNLVDMTGQPQYCEVCGAPNRREWSFLICTKDPNHVMDMDCSEAAQAAVAARWGAKPKYEQPGQCNLF